MDNFIEYDYPHNEDGVNLAVENINYIFDYLAIISHLKTPKKNHKQNQKNEKWFDLDCKRIKKN